jgi:hypothetical protein
MVMTSVATIGFGGDGWQRAGAARDGRHLLVSRSSRTARARGMTPDQAARTGPAAVIA